MVSQRPPVLKWMHDKGISIGAAMLPGLVVSGNSAIFAQESTSQVQYNISVSFENVPEDAVKNTLKWADGSECDYTGYDEAVKAAKEEKLPGTYTTDGQGRINLLKSEE